MPLLMAARGEQALALAGKIADGLMISNMCPPEFTRHAVGIMQRSAQEAGRRSTEAVVQYVPCAVASDRTQAHRLAKHAIGEMLPGFWSLAQRVPAAKAALLRAGDIAEAQFAAAAERLRRGEDASEVLDARFIDAFAIAGTADDCLAQARRYRAAGASELALTFVGAEPEAQMHYLTSAIDA
jgi:5,10-methylenetetrahydromethanopterin reductase